MSGLLVCQFLWDLLVRFEDCDSDAKGGMSILEFVRDRSVFPDLKWNSEGEPIVFDDPSLGIQGGKTVRDIFPVTYAEEGGMSSLCFMMEREAAGIFSSLEGEEKGTFRDIIQIALPNLGINLRHSESEDESMIREDVFGSLGL